MTLVARNDDNYAEAAREIAKALLHFTKYTPQEVEIARNAAAELSRTALWSELYAAYEKAYSEAIERSVTRTNRAVLNDGGGATEQINFVRQQLITEKPHWNRVMVEKVLPKRLHALEVLSHNLWWSWTSGARDLFGVHRPEAVVGVREEPDRIPRPAAARTVAGVGTGRFVPCDARRRLRHVQRIHERKTRSEGADDRLLLDGIRTALVVEDLFGRPGHPRRRLPQRGVGQERADGCHGAALPLRLLHAAALGAGGAGGDLRGAELLEAADFARARRAGQLDDRTDRPAGAYASARVWRCQVGRTDLFLLDTDYEANLDEDRQITHYLYGGDWENRLKQELLLGLGGIRALRAMGIKQEVYHCNEGHAAFIGIERIRDLVRRKLTFSEALEVVRSSSLFTTHTPVPAGHDAFPESMIRQYLAHYPDVLGITWEQFINLGKTNPNDPEERFSMSVLACNLSQEVNGVSWLHGEVSKDILGNMWPGYFKNELHIGYVTNGVHFPTWCASNLRRLYMRYFPEGFSGHDYDIPAWQKVTTSPPPNFGRSAFSSNASWWITSANGTATPPRCASTRRARWCRSSKGSNPTY